MEENNDSLRDVLDAAFDKAEETTPPEATSDEGTEKDVPTAKEMPEPETETPENEPTPVKKTEPVDKNKIKAKTEPSGEKEAPVQLPKSKAPGSWKPSARERWAGLPPEIQQEVLRRERDIATGFNEVAQVKKFRDDFGSIVNQHQHIISAEGGDAMKMTRDLYTTAAALYNGSQQQKVMTVAAMIKNFGVDLRMLDTVLAGQMSEGGQQQPAQMDIAAIIRQQVQQAIAPIFGQQKQQLETEVSNDIEAFANDPENEFFEDVKDTMADLLEVSAKQGKTMDLSTAYKRATMMHSEIADIISSRTLQSKATTNNNAAAQARKRAVSLRGTPSKELASGGAPDGKTSLADDIRASIDALSG